MRPYLMAQLLEPFLTLPSLDLEWTPLGYAPPDGDALPEAERGPCESPHGERPACRDPLREELDAQDWTERL